MSTIRLISSLAYAVERHKPELIPPDKPTPYEFKTLSDVDDQKSLRIHIPVIHFYQKNVEMEEKDPVKVIKEAIAKALVYYYPFAGRLREGPNDKLMVECTGEGAMFIEADANVKLAQFGDVLLPPFPGAEDLLYDIPGSGGILHCPLLLIQVTRFLCGGFVFAIRLNHVMSDAVGLLQFMTAVSDIARGAHVPSVKPVWKREFLNAREPPRLSCKHHVYEENEPGVAVLDCKGLPLNYNTKLVHRSFFFGPKEIAHLRNHLTPHLRSCSKVQILTACLWRSRTVALETNPGDKVGVSCAVGAHAKFNPPLPIGFYGNTLGLPVAISMAGQLCQNPLSYALELVKKSIADVTEEFVRSSTDLLAKKRSIHISLAWYYVSDLTHISFKDVDFGWGKALYAGPSQVNSIGGFFLPMTNKKGEDGIVMSLSLAAPAMERFVMEIDKLIIDSNDLSSSVVVSKL